MCPYVSTFPYAEGSEQLQEKQGAGIVDFEGRRSSYVVAPTVIISVYPDLSPAIMREAWKECWREESVYEPRPPGTLEDKAGFGLPAATYGVAQCVILNV